MQKHVRIQWKGHHLAATIHYPAEWTDQEKNARYPLVVICHGFIGSRVGVNRLFYKAAQELAEDRYVVIRFDYAGCGESDGDYGQTGLDDFIDQTNHVIDFGLQLNGVDADQLVLLGHSLGGAVASWIAANDSRVKKLILWAPVGQPYKDIVAIVGEKEVEKLKQKTFIDYMGYQLTSRFFRSLSLYHPLKEASRFQGDVIILHGTNDEDISAEYCLRYDSIFQTREKGTCEKRLIAGANHTFSSCVDQRDLFSETRRWLAAVLKRETRKKVV
ncbi:alpha/beta hydrolase family protein [Bacillus smithii]|jgi:alpha-beta hydrolase superfamily lysophospholipase|uniref:alpha/beta hydrolase family protein n=1 Tax=Bacillus smithii TaxID=1479 RepID=UPI002E1F40D1|nr:alpha/beta fold hydrolase [Bacillus smithii]MED4927908.1 alpha/beta fold hydrolase [Bacillus smithii]